MLRPPCTLRRLFAALPAAAFLCLALLPGCYSFNYMQAPVYVPRPSYGQATLGLQASAAGSLSGFGQGAGQFTVATRQGWIFGADVSAYSRSIRDCTQISPALFSLGRPPDLISNYYARGFSVGALAGRAWHRQETTYMLTAGLAQEVQRRGVTVYDFLDEAQYRARNLSQRVWLQGAMRACLQGYDDPTERQVYTLWALRLGHTLPDAFGASNVSLTQGPHVPQDPYVLEQPGRRWLLSLLGGFEYRRRAWALGYQMQFNMALDSAQGWYRGPTLVHTVQGNFVLPLR